MSDAERSDNQSPDQAERAPTPAHRPIERFWPYPGMTEHPSDEELASLDPDLRDALFGPQERPFSITLVFPRFDGPDFERAVAAARRGAEYREVGEGESFRVRARFYSSDPVGLRHLFEIVDRYEGCEVLVDDRPVPYARELWLPLVWYLLPL